MQAVLGVIAIVLQNVRTWPQVIRILRLQDATGVSTTTWSLATASHVVWLTYALVISDAVLTINNIVAGLGPASVLAALVHQRATSIRNATAAPILVGGIGVVALWTIGENALAVIAVAIGAVMFIPQVVKVCRSSTTGVSITTWLLLMFSSLSWIAYGITADIPAILAAHAVVLPSSIIVLSKVVTERRRLHNTL